jgi:SAM-dependent methyltransferase
MMPDLPYPHDELLMQITNERNLESFKESFGLYRRLIDDAMEIAEKPLGNESQIFDFGCGAGRLLYAYRNEIDVSRTMFGCDLNQRAVDWCK